MSVSSAASPANSAGTWPPLQGSWTFADYERLPDNGMRYEIIQGDVYMSSTPPVRHQQVVAELPTFLYGFLQKHPIGEIFLGPIDVRLSNIAAPGCATNVQPDLFIIAEHRHDIIGQNYINGSPDLVIEILSPRYEMFDRSVKFNAYAQAAIREYWIVDPQANSIEVNVLRGTAYVPMAVFAGRESIRSEVLPELTMIVGDVFPAELPN